MKLFRRIFLVGMLLSSTLFFFQCSSCKEDETVAPPVVVPLTSIEQLVGTTTAWKISSALKDNAAIVLAPAGSISLSLTKKADGTPNGFTINAISGVPSPTGTSITGTYAVTGAGTGEITFNAGGASSSKVNYTLTPFGGTEVSNKLVLEWSVLTPNKPTQVYKYTFTR